MCAGMVDFQWPTHLERHNAPVEPRFGAEALENGINYEELVSMQIRKVASGPRS